MSRASAPGKVILFGEHAVVYGRPAIAVPVAGVSATAELQPALPGSGFKIVAADLNCEFLLSAASSNDPLAAAVRITLDYFKQPCPPHAVLRVTSSIPLGRGLGSGAAVSTAVVRVLSKFLKQDAPPATVSNLVYQVEKLHHGTPSGIDNSVVAYQQPVYFVKRQPIRRMIVAAPFTLLIGDTGVIASTRNVVGNLRQRWQANPQLYEGYFDEISVITRHAKVLVEQKAVFNGPALGKLMNENQDVLESLGVSSPDLQRLIDAARQAGAWGAKLSGAGWGGNMIALVPSDQSVILSVQKALRHANATGVLVTTVK